MCEIVVLDDLGDRLLYILRYIDIINRYRFIFGIDT